MHSESSKHLGLGLVVGFALFASFYWDPLGVMPETDLGVPLGIGFGSGFSATVISWLAAARKAAQVEDAEPKDDDAASQ
jgi:hypothetical protein